MIELNQNIDFDNPEFQQAYRILQNTNANVFLTGKAGTGKSTFLRYICKHINKKHVVLAPTGVAAVNVGGVTIHSFFQMPLRPVPPDDPDYSVANLKKSQKFSKNKKKLLRELELIVIDEVSMVRPDMIDFIDRTLRAVTGKRRVPFGGVQLLLVGDIFQLEPVVTSESKAILSRFYSDFFFFNARAYAEARLISIELKKIYRQSDTSFISLLDRVRMNRIRSQDLNILNSLVKNCDNPGSGNDAEFGITLTARRDNATKINDEKMEALPGKEYLFEGEIIDDFPDRILPTDLNLKLKINAQVMLIRNDRERRWVNGTLARIKKITGKAILIELENGDTESVEKEEWQNISYSYNERTRKIKEEVIGRFIQYPLRAAWALTIHKSQGLTFNNVTIDMGGGAFSAGQTYVALSRCRSLEGLSFVNPLMRGDIIVSKGASDFSRNFNDAIQADLALRESRMRTLSQEAGILFESCNFREAIEALWMAHDLNGLLSNESVRRFIATKLLSVKKLKDELTRKDRMLKSISQEFTQMGQMALGDIAYCDIALRNFEKACEVDPSNKDALMGKAKALHIIGESGKARKILDEFIKKRDRHAYEANLIKGVINMQAKDWSAATLNFMAAHKLKPKEPEPISHMIEVYDLTGQEDMASQMRSLLDDLMD